MTTIHTSQWQYKATRCHCGPISSPVSWSTDTNLCVWELLRDCLHKGMLTLLCLNCTATMCGKCLWSYYYSGPVPRFPSLCLQYPQPQQCPAAGGSEITVRRSSAGVVLHTLCCIWTWGPACWEYHSSANKKYIKDFTHSYCYCWNNCSGDDAWRPVWQSNTQQFRSNSDCVQG